MIADFVRYLEAERRYSPLTVRNYRHDVEQFLAWLGVDDARFEPQRITTDDIREWILYRTETGRVSAASMNREISSLRALFRWLLRTGAVGRDVVHPIPSLRTSQRLPAFAHPGQGRQGADSPDARIRARKDFTLHRVN